MIACVVYYYNHVDKQKQIAKVHNASNHGHCGLTWRHLAANGRTPSPGCPEGFQATIFDQ